LRSVSRAPGSVRRAIFLAAGPAAWLLLRFAASSDLSPAAANVLGLTGWMAIWWIGEPVPLGATSLLPLVLFPLLGVGSSKDAAVPYASELVFLFLAGFLLAAALERWNAHSRIAYAIVGGIGGSGRRVVLGVMLATGFVSMWISNTATAAMMYPIALAIGALFGSGRAADESSAGSEIVSRSLAAGPAAMRIERRAEPGSLETELKRSKDTYCGEDAVAGVAG
jgi:sodium-dependent dicarboxylate transporter 2/3/5